MAGYGDRSLAGIGGWLTFFLVVLGILSPLRILLETAQLHLDPNVRAVLGDNWPLLMSIEWLLSGAQLACLAFMVWRMINVQVWQSVRIVIAGLWILSIAIPVVELVMVSVIGGFALGELLEGSGLTLFQSLIFSSIWTAYLLRSERVANTYPETAGGDEVAEVFG